MSIFFRIFGPKSRSKYIHRLGEHLRALHYSWVTDDLLNSLLDRYLGGDETIDNTYGIVGALALSEFTGTGRDRLSSMGP